jgi:hypothetical protein
MVYWGRTVGGAPRRSPTGGTHPTQSVPTRRSKAAWQRRPSRRARHGPPVGRSQAVLRNAIPDHIWRTAERTAVVYAGGESRGGHRRGRGGAPSSRAAEVVVAGADAAHLRGGRIGLSPLWRPHAAWSPQSRTPSSSGGFSPTFGAPDRGAGAPAAAVRSVRLELRFACRRRRSRADASRGRGRRRDPDWVRGQSPDIAGRAPPAEDPLRPPGPADCALRCHGRGENSANLRPG